MIDLKFWKIKPARTNNPSYSSKLVEESLFVESFQKERFKPKNTAIPLQNTQPLNNKTQTNQTKEVMAQSLPLFTQMKPALSLASESHKQVIEHNIQKLAQSSPGQQHKIKQKVQSNMKALTREFNDFIASSNEVYLRQQKPFDIIGGTLKSHKSQINLFPKLRLQRLDSDYHKRQAFIRGDLQRIKNLEERSKSEVRFFSKLKYSDERNDFRQERTLLRRREPIEFAFKITQNPQIIKKKLVLEK